MRICPSCGLKVNNDLSNFCYSCGEKLPEQNTNISAGLNSIRNDLNGSQKATRKKINFSILSDWKVFVVGVNALSVLFFVFALGVFFRFGFTNSNGISKISPLLEINNVTLEKSDSFLAFRGFVLKNSFIDFSPLEIYSYIESSNSDVFLNNFLSSNDKKYLETSFELDFEDLLVFFKPAFAYVKKDNSKYALILETSGFDFFERAYSKYQANKKQPAQIYAKRIKEFLIISNDTEFLGDFEDVSNKLQNSLSTDANFKSAVSASGTKSLFFVYSNDSNYFEKDFSDDLKLFELESFTEKFKKFDANAYSISKFDNVYELTPLE